MYKIFADSTLIYDSTLEDYKIGKGEITLEIGKAGSFVFSMYPDHPFYDRLVKMKTIITVYRDNEIIFRGRPLDYKDDFHNNRVVTCEGALNFLHDSIIRPYSFQGTPVELFRKFVEEHNAQVDESKRFIIGEITVVDENDYIARSNSAYEDALENIEGHLIGETTGGQLFISYNDAGKTVINYYADFTRRASQAIEFGENLKDYTRTSNAEGIVTVLIPLGAKLADSEKRLTIAPINDGKDYIEDADAIAVYGRIVSTFEWDNVTVINNLLTKGEGKLAELSKQNTTIELTAIDLHLLDRSIESYGYGMYIPVVSKPHGLNVSMLCQKQTINLLNPGNDTLVLGYTLSSLTDSGKKTSSSIKKVQQNVNETSEKIDQLPNTYVVIDELNAKIQTYIDSETGKTGIVNALKSTYLTVNDLGEYVTKTDLSASVDSYLSSPDGIGSITQAVSGTYLTKDALTGYATEKYVTSNISSAISPIESKISLEAAYGSNTIGSNVRALLQLVTNADSSNIRLSANAISLESIPGKDGEYSLNTSGFADYGFDLDYLGSFNGYVSQNKGVDNSAAVARINLKGETPFTLTLRVCQSSENGYDYGIIYPVDYTPEFGYDDDLTAGYKSFKGDSNTEEQTITIPIPAGEHFVYIKYRKDSSQASGNDGFGFWVESTAAGSGTLLALTSGGTVLSSANISIEGTVTFTDLETEGATIINGANIQTENLYVGTVWATNSSGAHHAFISYEYEGTNNLVMDIGRTDSAVDNYPQTINLNCTYLNMVDKVSGEGFTIDGTTFDASSYNFKTNNLYAGNYIYIGDTGCRLYVNSSGTALKFYDANGNTTTLNA